MEHIICYMNNPYIFFVLSSCLRNLWKHSNQFFLSCSFHVIILDKKMVDYLKKALIYGHTSRISSWIYYQFTTFEGKSLDMPPPNPASPATSTQHWERINENWIRRRRGVSLSLYTGEQERRFFYALMLRIRGKKSLDLQGIGDAFLT